MQVTKENLEEIKKKLIELKEKGMTGYPTIDMPWLKLYDKEFKIEDIPHLSIYQMVYNANKDHMDRIAIDLRSSLNNYEEFYKFTYEKLFAGINTFAKANHELGVKENEIVPFILPNIVEARELIYGNSILAATTYPISPLLPVKQLERIIQENELKNLFIFAPFYEKYQKAIVDSPSLENVIMVNGTESLPQEMVTGEMPKVPVGDKYVSFAEILQAGQKGADITPRDVDDLKHIAVIEGTSGTTGLSKGACLTDYNINAASLSFKNGRVFEGSFLDALMPSIAYGLSMMNYQMLNGSYVYMLNELLLENTPKALVKLAPDNFSGGPIHYIILKSSPEYQNGLIPKHNNYISGGASLPKELEEELNGPDRGRLEHPDDNIFVRQGYGLTEYVAKGSYTKIGSYKFGSVGIPLPYDVISVFEPNTDKELPYYQEGEICITGPSVMQGYLNNPEETDKIIKVHSDGKRWIHTQDIGYMDEDGCVYHVDRIKNIFMRTGFNVHPTKIADFIATIPGVKNVAVIGFEHPSEQCVPIAFIEFSDLIKNSEQEQELIEQIKLECYHNLEETSIPFDYIVVDTIPINLGGKIDTALIKSTSGIDFKKEATITRRRLKFNK